MIMIWNLILLVAVLIGIFKNKKGEYLKQSSIALMVLSTVAAIFFAYIDATKAGATQIGMFDAQDLTLYLQISLHGIIFGLILYLFSSRE